MRLLYSIILFLTLSSVANAGFIGSVGGAFSSGFESVDYKATNDKSFLTLDGGAGLIFEGELPLSFLSISASFSTADQKGKTEFVRSNGSIISELETEADSLLASASLRLRFINFKRFKLFIGGGPTFGTVKLQFDKTDFTNKGGPSSEYKEEESFGTYGGHFEIGSEWIVDKKQAVRGYVKLVDTKTGKVDAFGDKSISIDYAQFMLQYMYYFDWKFRRSSRE